MARKTFTDESLATFVEETKAYVDGKVSTKANSSHNHAASNITSGTLSSDRLPTVPVTKGGTGATTAAAALTNLGITATAAELNKLDGVTATTTELNYVDGVTSGIQAQLDGKAASGHTHNYAGSSSAGGSATSAVKLDTATAGTSTTPVYFSSGKPTACSREIPQVHTETQCTTFTSDTGTCTPAAVQKAAKQFAIPRPNYNSSTHKGSATDKAITRYSGTEGAVQDSKIIIEDVTNSRDSSQAQVIAIPASGGKKMVYGYCTDQVDGTSFIGGVFDASATSYPYAEGLAIGGSSGNLLWKGAKVATATDLDGKANSSHNHSGANITSGTVAAARLPVASTSASGIINTDSQSFTGSKTFSSQIVASSGLKTGGTIVSDTALTDTLGTGDIPFESVYGGAFRIYGAASKLYGSFRVETKGTTSATGLASITLGNDTVTGTANNARGRIYFYGTGTGYTTLEPSYNSDSVITVKLPSSDGTLALDGHKHAAGDITSGTLSSSRLPTVPVDKGGTGSTTASAARTALGITPANIGAATSAQGTLADNAMPKSGGTFTGEVTHNAAIKTNSSIYMKNTLWYLGYDTDGTTARGLINIDGSGDINVGSTTSSTKHSGKTVINGGTGNSIKLNAPTSIEGALTLSSALTVANGGTGQTSATTTVTYTANTTNATGTTYTCKYIPYIGMTFIRIYIKSAVAMNAGTNYEIGTIASGYRPASTTALALYSSKDATSSINSSGVVRVRPLESISSGTEILIAGFWFV